MDDTLETPAAQVADIGGATLTPLVQRALGGNTAEVTGWRFQQLGILG